MTIRNLNWELETTFTRKQVLAMAKVAEFGGNIKSDLTKGFPSTFKEFDWTSVQEVMTLFANLGSEDTLGYRALCKVAHDVNDGRVQLQFGRVVPVEESSGG